MNSNFGNDCWEENYKSGRFNKYPYDEVVSFVLKNYKEKSIVLDLGCGGGNHSLFCINEGHDVIAVDGSKTSLELTTKLCSNSKNLTCLHNDLSKLDIDDNTVNCIIDRQSMGHNSRDNIQNIIKELYRVLQKGGKIISFIFSQSNQALVNDKYIGENNYYKFETGPFLKSGYVYFTEKEDILELFKDFNILDIRKSSSVSLINDFSNEYFAIEAQKR